jgi:hypothetical protein
VTCHGQLVTPPSTERCVGGSSGREYTRRAISLQVGVVQQTDLVSIGPARPVNLDRSDKAIDALFLIVFGTRTTRNRPTNIGVHHIGTQHIRDKRVDSKHEVWLVEIPWLETLDASQN